MFRRVAGMGTRMFLGLAVLGLTIGLGLGAMFTVVPTLANHNGDGTVHVCVNDATGVMREVNNPIHCRSWEHTIDLQGSNAPGPVSGYNVVQTQTVQLDPGEVKWDHAFCTGETNVLGGGVRTDNLLTDVVDSGPIGSDGWTATIFNGSAVPVSMNVYAICADTEAP